MGQTSFDAMRHVAGPSACRQVGLHTSHSIDLSFDGARVVEALHKLLASRQRSLTLRRLYANLSTRATSWRTPALRTACALNGLKVRKVSGLGATRDSHSPLCASHSPRSCLSHYFGVLARTRRLLSLAPQQRAMACNLDRASDVLGRACGARVASHRQQGSFKRKTHGVAGCQEHYVKKGSNQRLA